MKMSKRPASSDGAGNGQNGKRKFTENHDGLRNGDSSLRSNDGTLTTCLSLPGLVSVTPWASHEILDRKPELPRILDSAMEKTVFTHPGMLGESYERLEWLGDAYLELIASNLIFQTFKDLPSGRCSQLRERLIRNTNIAEYFKAYNLTEKARLPEEIRKGQALGKGRSADKDLIKVQGDMFEAYVAAAIVSDPINGLSNTTNWLKALFGRTIKQDIVAYEKEQERKKRQMASGDAGVTAQENARRANLPARDQLQIAIGAKGINIRYEDRPRSTEDKNLKMPLYTVDVYLDGWGESNKLLGTGTALAKKEAAQKAAQKALENNKLVRKYESKKKAFTEAMKAAEEADGAGS